jgi:hypothetical protein
VATRPRGRPSAPHSRDLRPVYTAPSEAAAKRTVRGSLDHVGPAMPGGGPAVGERLEGVRAVPGLCQPWIHRLRTLPTLRQVETTHRNEELVAWLTSLPTGAQ